VRGYVQLAAMAFAGLAASQALAQAGCLSSFIEPQRRHVHNTAPPAKTAQPLPAGQPLGTVTYRPRGAQATQTLDDYLGMYCTTGLLVLHDGQVVFERYLQRTRPGDGLLSASMSKTLLSLLIGIAVADGKLSLQDRVVDVLPDFEGSAFAQDSVEELLRMTSGVELKNSYQRGEASDNQVLNPMLEPQRDVRAYLKGKTAMAVAGKTFNYNGAVTALLGLMLSARTGMSNTDYLTQRLWEPMGAEAPGYWIKNWKGQEGVQGQFVATLRDYARIGQLMLNQGRVADRQVVPQAWIAQMTALRRDKPQPAQAPFYGLQVWIPQAAGGRSFAWGTNGQNIFIDPVAKTVIVHTGNSPDAEFNGNAHLFPLRDAIAAALK
jgi:CubicO group peptidase (beta-lactamase class C family)